MGDFESRKAIMGSSLFLPIGKEASAFKTHITNRLSGITVIESNVSYITEK